MLRRKSLSKDFFFMGSLFLSQNPCRAESSFFRLYRYREDPCRVTGCLPSFVVLVCWVCLARMEAQTHGRGRGASPVGLPTLTNDH
jgi:hypothetical protein